MDLPYRMTRHDRGDENARTSGPRVLIWFPALAAVNGFLLVAIAQLVEALSDRYVSALAFALVTLAYLLVRHSGRGWVALISWTLNMFDGYGFSDALSAVRSDQGELDRDWGWAAMIALALLLLLLLFLLGLFGEMCFIAAILAGSAAVQGEVMLAAPAEEGGLSDPQWFGRVIMWFTFIGSEVFWFFFYPVATVSCALLVIFAMCWIIGTIRSTKSRLSAETAAWTVAAVELLMLMCGALLTM